MGSVGGGNSGAHHLCHSICSQKKWRLGLETLLCPALLYFACFLFEIRYSLHESGCLQRSRGKEMERFVDDVSS